MKTLLTKAQAWRLIAQRIYDRGLAGLGLCREISELEYTDRISRECAYRMREAVNYHLGGSIFFDEQGVESTRILAALFLAEEAEDEERNAPRIVVDEWRGDTHHVRVEIRAE